jgi:hypothetical protein
MILILHGRSNTKDGEDNLADLPDYFSQENGAVLAIAFPFSGVKQKIRLIRTVG